MTTLPALRSDAANGPATAERKVSAEAQLRRNLGITDSVRERVRTRLADVEIEDSPIKQRDFVSRGRRDEQLLSKIRGASPASSLSSNDSISVASGRPALIGGGKGSRPPPRHAQRQSSASSANYAFPNEYSIPTIPIPPCPSEDEIAPVPNPPASPSRFRRRTATTSSNSRSGVREISVRFDLPPESSGDEDILPVPRDRLTGGHSHPLTSTPKVPFSESKTQQFIEAEASSFDSAKSFISAYNTPSSANFTPARFRRESPSKLLRTLSRATSVTPASIARSTDSVDNFQTPAPIRRSLAASEEEEESIDEADRTLDSIIASTDDARRRVRRIMSESGRESSREVSFETRREEPENKVPEVSVWSDKSFFSRMARKAPGGWAFTPQPKFGRTIELDEEEEEERVENQIKDQTIQKRTAETGAKWWEFWRTKRKPQDQAKPPDPPSPQRQQLIPSQPTSPLTTTSLNRSASPPKPIPPTSVTPSPIRPSSPTQPPPPANGKPSLSKLSEKRLRLARSLSLLQSDIRTAREGIESLESRLERISAASRARAETSERAVIARRARGDPPPQITVVSPNVAPVDEFPRTGTYIWLPFSRGWVVGLLWVILVLQAGMIFAARWKRGASEGWEPYSFGEWSRGEKWPT